MRTSKAQAHISSSAFSAVDPPVSVEENKTHASASRTTKRAPKERGEENDSRLFPQSVLGAQWRLEAG